MHDLLTQAGGSGTNVQGIFQRAVASTIHSLLYGFRVKNSNDPILRAVIKLNDEFSD